MNRRTGRRVKNRAPQKLAKKIFEAASILFSACIRATLPPPVHGNVRSSKELGDDRPLPSPRHELFAQAVASGMSASKSYALAYSRPRNGATRASAARLLTNANVRRRIAKLRVEAAEQAKASLRVLIPALEEQARAALTAGRSREASTLVRRLQEIAGQERA
jgi:hypothetical protein